MSIITRMRKQKAVYWATPVPDGHAGFTWTAPVEISCRWDDEQKIFVDPSGEEKLSTAIIYPDRVLTLEGYLWEGTLVDLEEDNAVTTDPRNIDGARQIKQLAKTPNLRNTETLYTAYVI